MDDTTLLAAISAEETAALGTLQSDIGADRADALDRYLGKPYGDEIAGRSSVVSRDVADVVEGVLANVLKPFVAGDRLVAFDPSNETDVEQAEQESDYINYVVTQRNNGFLVLNSGIKDALLLRNGYARCQWRVRDDVQLEMYEGQSDEQLAALMQDAEVEVIQHSERPDPQAMLPSPQMMMPGAPQPPAPMVHDIKVRRKHATEYVEIIPLPPDCILVGDRTTTPSLQDTDFFQIRMHLSLSYLRQQGYAVDDDISDSENAETLEDYSRNRFSIPGTLWEDNTGDPARRIVLFKTSFIRIDRDGDGKAELRRICTVGQNILEDEETDVIEVAAFTGTLMPHQHLGLSVYDQIQDVARLKTALMRQFMDNKYLANNGRTGVDFNKVNLDDMLVSRPGGIIRVDGPPGESMMPVIVPDTGTSALQGLEYLDSVRENRTGYTRNAQGMGSDSLTSNTATGAIQQLNQSQMRLEMTARTIAETGVKDLFRIVHAMTLKHASKADKVRLRNKFVMVDPRTWVKRLDMSLTVALGIGTNEQQFGKLMALAPMLQQASAQGLAGPKEIYNFGAELVKTAGFKNTEQFIHAPAIGPDGKPVQPPPPTPPEVQIEQMRSQAKAQQLQAEDVQHARQLQMEDQVKQREAQAQLMLQKSNDDRQAQLDQQKLQFDLMRLDKEQQTELRKAEIQAAATMEVARINRGLDDGLKATQEMMAQAGLNAQAIVEQLHAVLPQIAQALAGHAQAMQAHAVAANAPKRIVRDPLTGRATGLVAGNPPNTLQ